jgi:hypothetical protein
VRDGPFARVLDADVLQKVKIVALSDLAQRAALA